jgi:WD40 repeat protein
VRAIRDPRQPDSSLIAAASRDGTVSITAFDETQQSLAQVARIHGHEGAVLTLLYASPCHTFPLGALFTAGIDKTIRVHVPLKDDPSGQWTHIQTLSGHSGAVCALAWDDAHCILASASWDHSVRLWTNGYVFSISVLPIYFFLLSFVLHVLLIVVSSNRTSDAEYV